MARLELRKTKDGSFAFKARAPKLSKRTNRVCQPLWKSLNASAKNPRIESLTRLSRGGVGSFLFGAGQSLSFIEQPSGWTIRRSDEDGSVNVSICVNFSGARTLYERTVKVLKVGAFANHYAARYVCNGCQHPCNCLHICHHMDGLPLLCVRCSGCLYSSCFISPTLDPNKKRHILQNVERYYRLQKKLMGHYPDYETIPIGEHFAIEFWLKAPPVYKKKVIERLDAVYESLVKACPYEFSKRLTQD